MNDNKIELNHEQRQALELLRKGDSFFLTGKAGTGKTVTLRALILDCRHRNVSYAVTASTGIAAILLGGKTIHGWSGMRFGNETLSQLLGRLTSNSPSSVETCFNITTCQTLFIDEITMLSNDFFNKFESICRTLRNNKKPFGGIQMIVSGDFFQLGQIHTGPDRRSNDSREVKYVLKNWMRRSRHAAFTEDIMSLIVSYWSATYTGEELQNRYLFLSSAWQRSILKFVYLTQTYRQTDPAFLELLERARHGSLTKDDDLFFRNRIGRELTSYFQPLLHPWTKHVAAENTAGLKALHEQHEYIAYNLLIYRNQNTYLPIDMHRPPASSHQRHHYHKLLEYAKQLPTLPSIHCKIGAPIIIVQNNKLLGIANGQRGIITNIVPAAPRSSRRNRCTQLLQTTTLMNDREDVIEVKLEDTHQPIRLMRHSFRIPERDAEMQLDPNEWTGTYEILQFPFSLCYALTIHKSQGQSLTAAKLYLGKDIQTFGQAYVALSRLKSVDGLSVEAYDREAFLTDPLVEDFYKFIEQWCRM